MPVPQSCVHFSSVTLFYILAFCAVVFIGCMEKQERQLPANGPEKAKDETKSPLQKVQVMIWTAKWCGTCGDDIILLKQLRDRFPTTEFQERDTDIEENGLFFEDFRWCCFANHQLIAMTPPRSIDS